MEAIPRASSSRESKVERKKRLSRRALCFGVSCRNSAEPRTPLQASRLLWWSCQRRATALDTPPASSSARTSRHSCSMTLLTQGSATALPPVGLGAFERSALATTVADRGALRPIAHAMSVAVCVLTSEGSLRFGHVRSLRVRWWLSAMRQPTGRGMKKGPLGPLFLFAN